MFFIMLKILYTTSFIWAWLLVFPTSVGMEWNSNQEITSAVQISNEFNTYKQLQIKKCKPSVRLFDKDSSFKFLKQIFPHDHKSVGVKATISLHQAPGEKRCSRSTYNQVERYAYCGIKENVALLPVLDLDAALNQNGSYVKDLRKEITPQGDLDFVFDGKKAVRFPTKQLQKNWFTSYTISGYILVNNYNERQYIVSWSSGDTPDRQMMGFYVKSSHDGTSLKFGFSHTHKDEMCFLTLDWKVNEKANTWHFFTLSFARCKARFSLNGRRLPPYSTRAHVFEPEKHLQPKFVVGARWSGGVNKYADYFHGQISGLILSRKDIYDNDKILDCILKCKEHFNVFIYSDNYFPYLENNRGSVINIRGGIKRKRFENILKNLAYNNLNWREWNKRRLITLDVSNEYGTQVRKIFEVKTSRFVPRTRISGTCRYDNIPIKSDGKGALVCPHIEIYSHGCEQSIDTLIIRSMQRLNKSEYLFVPAETLQKHAVKTKTLDSGLLIYGASLFIDYRSCIRQLHYINNASEKTNVSRTFEVIATTYNGLVKSNKFVIKFNTADIKDKPPLQHAGDTDKVYQDATIILSVVIFGLVLLLPLLFFCYQKCIRPHRSTQSTFNVLDDSLVTHNRDDFDSSVHYFDWREPPRIKIDPSERVSINNDPLADLLVKDSLIPECSVTDGSIYSDYDGDESDFENDSIRQLEWDCLEKNLTYPYDR